jgi:amyloid beta precursor protein binding protein 1
MASPAPADARYDRQLRLWGAEGQRRLARCRVLALGASPATCETMKNLILGGIRAFEMVDDGAWRRGARSAGETFELTCEDVERGARERGGKTMAETVVERLAALNPGVDGAATTANARATANAGKERFERYDAVVAGGGGLSDHDHRALARACAESGTVLVTTRARGLFGEARTSASERWATENVAPEGSTAWDLRLDKPWGELGAYVEMKTSDLDRLDGAAFKHVPFVALLAHAAAACGTRDRRSVKDALTSMRRGMDEENFDEAIANVRYAWTDTGAVTKEVEEIIRDERARALTLESDKFWFLAAALREFVDREGCLPLEGSIPDMTSTTESYVELQRLYSDKAARDAACVWESAKAFARDVGAPHPEEFIPERDAKIFCKNCRHVRFVTWRSMEDELFPSPAAGTSEMLAQALADPSKAMSACIFAGLRAADKFTTLHGRSPGVRDAGDDSTVDGDDDEFVRRDGESVRAFMADWFEASEVKLSAANDKLADDVAYEIARYGDSQIHAVGAVLGGIASQELIKIITGQYLPMTKPLVYDAVSSTMATLF